MRKSYVRKLMPHQERAVTAILKRGGESRKHMTKADREELLGMLQDASCHASAVAKRCSDFVDRCQGTGVHEGNGLLALLRHPGPLTEEQAEEVYFAANEHYHRLVACQVDGTSRFERAKYKIFMAVSKARKALGKSN